MVACRMPRLLAYWCYGRTLSLTVSTRRHTMQFNEKIISLRKSMGLSQEELGAELHVSRQTISKWESAQSYPDFQRLGCI